MTCAAFAAEASHAFKTLELSSFGTLPHAPLPSLIIFKCVLSDPRDPLSHVSYLYKTEGATSRGELPARVEGVEGRTP